MKLRNRFGKQSAEKAKIESERASAADFHDQRITQEAEFDAAKESSNSPQGNYEYEQRIAEDVNFDTRRMIAEAAFFIAERRGFSSGQEESDWLQAEIDVEDSLRNAQQVSSCAVSV